MRRGPREKSTKAKNKVPSGIRPKSEILQLQFALPLRVRILFETDEIPVLE